MKQAFVLAATLSLAASLAACNQAPADDATAPAETPAATTAAAGAEATTAVDPSVAGFEAAAPGNYEIVHADGSIDQLTVHPGLTWSRVTAKGDATGGTIFAQDGKNASSRRRRRPPLLPRHPAPAADGSIEVTGDDGEKWRVVRPAKRR